jgi:hypothetical protein
MSPVASPTKTEPPPRAHRFGWWLALICADVLILRLVIDFVGRHDTLSGDGFGYSIEANLNARGEWFATAYGSSTTPDALHPPVWKAGKRLPRVQQREWRRWSFTPSGRLRNTVVATGNPVRTAGFLTGTPVQFILAAM